MKGFSSALLLCASVTTVLAAKKPISDVKRETNLRGTGTKFIVEVDNSRDIPSKRSFSADGRSLLSPHEKLYARLAERGVGFDVNKEFNHPGLFVGASVELTNSADVTELHKIEGVKAVRPVVKFARPQPVSKHVISGPNDATIPADTESTHVMTNVDKVHAAGNIGSGVQIGIIDTGTDYTHPALGGGFGSGFKVAGGFDFVGDDYTGDNAPVPDDDPLDQCEGHGTHVAGIIGADPDANPVNISGVAYGATIFSYRIFGCAGFVTDDVIIDALLRGVDDGMNILTMSLGGPDGWTESSSSVVSSRIAETGTVVTVAAGNEGDSGAWFTSSPSNGINAISVASVNNIVIPVQNATVQGADHAPITYNSALPFNSTTRPVFATSNDTTVADDACDPLPDSTPNLSEFLVVVKRGTCSFEQKIGNIIDKGAEIAFIYNNAEGFLTPDLGRFAGFPAAIIQTADGEFLVEQFAAGNNITVSFPQNASTGFPDDATGGLVSEFSTYGPTNDFFFKPAIGAPGGNILSTFPVPLGSYAVLSGTSMATPFVAGVSALLFAAKGTTPEVGTSAMSLFESTGQPVASDRTDGAPLQTLTQQGGGLIDAFAALNTEVVISPTELITNDTAHFVGSHTFTVTNTGSSEKTFSLTHVPVGTAQTVQTGTIFCSLGPVPLLNDTAEVTFPSSLTVAAGSSSTVDVTIALPDSADASIFPVFSGFIELASGNETLRVSYLSLKGALHDKQVIDDTDFFFGVPLPTILDASGNVQEDPTNYTFADGDFPTILWRFAFGTPRFVIDLVPADNSTNSSSNAASPGKRAEPFLFPQAKQSDKTAPSDSLGVIAEGNWFPRNDDVNELPENTLALETPTFANGTTIPNGQYKFELRALRVTGDANNDADYESWTSIVFGVQA